MSSVLLDEDVYRNYPHKGQIKPREKHVGGCVGVLHHSSHITNLISHSLFFSVDTQRFTVTQPRESGGEKSLDSLHSP